MPKKKYNPTNRSSCPQISGLKVQGFLAAVAVETGRGQGFSRVCGRHEACEEGPQKKEEP